MLAWTPGGQPCSSQTCCRAVTTKYAESKLETRAAMTVLKLRRDAQGRRGLAILSAEADGFGAHVPRVNVGVGGNIGGRMEALDSRTSKWKRPRKCSEAEL